MPVRARVEGLDDHQRHTQWKDRPPGISMAGEHVAADDRKQPENDGHCYSEEQVVGDLFATVYLAGYQAEPAIQD